jgi:hypothetical protein
MWTHAFRPMDYNNEDEYIKAIVTTAPKVTAIQALLLFKHITIH